MSLKKNKGFRTIFFTLFCGVLLFCSPLSAQTTISLDSCVKWAIDNYPLVEQLRLINLSRDYNIKNINTGYIPEANILAFGGYIEGIPSMGQGTEIEPWRFAGMFHLQQTVWDGGVLISKKKIATAEAEVDKSVVEVKINDIRKKVAEIYFSILLSQAQQSELNTQMESLRKLLKTLRAAAKEGSLYESDADAIEVKVLQNEQSLVQLQTAEKSYRQMLSAFTYRNIDLSTILEQPLIVMQLQEGGDFEKRPEITLFENRKQLLNAYNPGAGEVLPKVSLQGMGLFTAPEFKLSTTSLDHILAGGISITWSIGGRAYTMGMDKKRLKVEKDLVDKEKESFILGQKMNLNRAESLMEQWNTVISYDDKIIDILSRRTRSSQSRYDNGVAPITDWLECVSAEGAAKQSKALHEIQKIMAIHQYNTELGY